MADARILIVEDEGIEALDLQHRLAGLGYTVPDIVSSGEEAVIKAGETHPDLILMDIMLQGEMDGVTAAERIRAHIDIPVIFLTAYADEKTLQRAKITEPYGYLVKPFKEKDLHISIDMALYKHAMEKKLKESEKWFATTLGSIGDAVIAADKDGLIMFMNPVAERLTGWKKEDAFNKNMTEVLKIINMDTRETVENPIAKVLREGITVGLANHTILIARDGTELPIDDSAAPITDERGNIIGMVLVFRDVTERKRAEEELRLAHTKLERRAFELNAVNRELEAFAYTVSHDLKAPLRSIEGFARAIAEDYIDKLNETGRDYLRRVTSACQRMTQFIDAMLNMARLTAGELHEKRVDLGPLAQGIDYDLRRKEPQRHVAFAVPFQVPAKGDATMLQMVLQNLLDNAWKFTGKHPAAKIEFGAAASNGKTVYFVRDDGAGFDMQYADKLFLPFKRLHSDSEFPGLGIGLAIAHRIIVRHGGRMWAESAPDKGATFYFTLD